MWKCVHSQVRWRKIEKKNVLNKHLNNVFFFMFSETSFHFSLFTFLDFMLDEKIYDLSQVSFRRSKNAFKIFLLYLSNKNGRKNMKKLYCNVTKWKSKVHPLSFLTFLSWIAVKFKEKIQEANAHCECEECIVVSKLLQLLLLAEIIRYSLFLFSLQR